MEPRGHRSGWQRIVTLTLMAALAVSVVVPTQTAAVSAAPGVRADRADGLGANLLDDADEVAERGDEDEIAPLASPPSAPVGATRDYTPEEIRSAKPLPASAIVDASSGPRVASRGRDGPPGSVPPTLPDRSGAAIEEAELDDLVAAALRFAVPVPARVDRQFPFVTVGELIFKVSGQPGLFHCTAASIGNAAVWTAAHCLFNIEKKAWNTDIAFIPASRGGSQPFGQWRASKLFVHDKYGKPGNPSNPYDYGGAILQRNTQGKKISQVVGALGFAWNQPPLGRTIFGLGYPNGPPANGDKMFSCGGTTWIRDTKFARFGAPIPVGAYPCDMDEGSSGGPWLVRTQTDSRFYYLGGNHAYDYPNKPPRERDTSWSPYFDTAAKAFWDKLRRQEPAAGCDRVTNSGGEGVKTTDHEMGDHQGEFTFSWEAYSIPDRFQVFYEGRQIHDTGVRSGSGSVELRFGSERSTSTLITVRVTADQRGTLWQYTVRCPE